ncbi:MAG: hypothetical protein AAF555_05905 [Verrucomicrobiota bacterium]
MKAIIPFCAAGAALFLSSCVTTSISNASHPSRSSWRGGGNSLYRGELATADLLGLSSAASPTEAAIQSALRRGKAGVNLSPGARVMLLQSVALRPDPELLSAMNAYFDPQVFSGIPPKGGGSPEMQAKSLRLAAARAGASHVICVFGTLETSESQTPGAALSWVPLGGELVPDKDRRTRINLTALVMNVSSGNWRSVSSASVGRRHVSAGLNRSLAWDQQVLALKSQAYPLLAKEITAL